MSKKSYKREVAGALLILWGSFGVDTFWFSQDAAEVAAKGEILVGLALWIVTPALAMFGLDAHLKKDKD